MITVTVLGDRAHPKWTAFASKMDSVRIQNGQRSQPKWTVFPDHANGVHFQ
jgi:hypothetical protein